ncbi:type VI secretion system baseplate subunit TssK [Helicobacter bilis]|uniref:type VI secretion system baseplate subunit TssK n=1 Tax=Helicobacter bilis TaxID=37372 RepID=UPI00051CE9E8|nr:type VI secretion system baseplate subunit TssK [Helicobacter bilis]TLE07564.1 type VI secretion system baseplate subunit TssK [Helicobacter bilis]
MNSRLKVVWYNGMNVDKIHFEQQERYFEQLVYIKTTKSLCNFYGLFEVEFSNELLNLGKIALSRISGIAQDGSVFNAPSDDLLPQALEINSNVGSPIITLKIPVSSDSIADISLNNTFSNSKYVATNVPVVSKIHDDVNEYTQQADSEISYTHQTSSLVLGSLRLKLGLLGDKSPNELEIPIAKIKNIHHNKRIELDDKFIPTSMDISNNLFIKTFLEEMLFSIQQHKETFTKIFRGINQTKNTLDFSTYLSLNLLKKYDCIFSYLINKERLHPEFLYEKLIEFQADLLVLHHEIEESFEFIAYKHNNLSSVFIPLSNHLRLLFANVTSPKYAIASVVDNGNGFFDCIFENASIIQNGEIFLAISSSLPTNTLLEIFTTQTKIHTQSAIKNVVASQLKGLHLEPIQSIPPALPHLSGYIYFKLDKKDSLFSHFANQNTVSIYMTNNIISPDIKLWALF